MNTGSKKNMRIEYIKKAVIFNLSWEWDSFIAAIESNPKS